MALLSVEQQFRTAMLANAAVAAALPGGLYEVQLPQNVPTYPVGSFQRISTQRNWVNAQGGQFSDFGWVRFQVDLWSNTETADDDVSQAAQAIIVALRTFNAYSSASQGGSARVMNQRTHVEPNTQPPMWREMLDIQIWFSDNT